MRSREVGRRPQRARGSVRTHRGPRLRTGREPQPAGRSHVAQVGLYRPMRSSEARFRSITCVVPLTDEPFAIGLDLRTAERVQIAVPEPKTLPPQQGPGRLIIGEIATRRIAALTGKAPLRRARNSHRVNPFMEKALQNGSARA
jgi:hypothetical protein